MADPITGAIVGGITRLAPEILGFFDRRNERKHELEMGKHQLQLIELQSHTRQEEIAAQGEQSQAVTALEALRDAQAAQMRPTGIRWIDALSSSVRPVWTYIVLLSWASVKVTNLVVSMLRADDWEKVQAILWTTDDAAMLSTLATFWFLDRVIRKAPVR